MEFDVDLKGNTGVVGGLDRIGDGIGGWKRAVVNPNMFPSSSMGRKGLASSLLRSPFVLVK